jgi:hypothetical protein
VTARHMAADRPWRLVRAINTAAVFVAGAMLAALLMLGVPMATDETNPTTPTTVPVVQPYPTACIV